jgi:hypothetical protein
MGSIEVINAVATVRWVTVNLVVALLADRHKLSKVVPVFIPERLTVMRVQNDTTIPYVGATPPPTVLAS